MAKSERKSKWRMKMRQLKRVKCSAKELVRLNKTLENGKVNMEAMEAIANVRETNQVEASVSEVDRMNVDGETSTVKKLNRKTKRDEEGKYPVWMNQRSIKKIKKRLDKSKKKKNKK